MLQNHNLFGATQDFGEVVIPLYHKKKKGGGTVRSQVHDQN